MSTLQTDTLVNPSQAVDGSEPTTVNTEIKTEEKAQAPATNSATEELIIIEPVAASPNVSTTTVIEPAKSVSEEKSTETKTKPATPIAPKTAKTGAAKVETNQPKVKTEPAVTAASETVKNDDKSVVTEAAKNNDVLIVPDANTEQLATIQHPVSTASTVVPTELKSTSNQLVNTDWILVAVFVLTSIIVLFSNRRAIKKATELAKESSRPVMPTLNPSVDVEFEKAKIVAESRQQWIHTLRGEIADFVSATNAIWDLHKIKDGFEDILTDMKDPQFAMKELYQWSCTYNKAVQDTEKLYAKIHLLINPSEEHSQNLSSLLDKTMVAIEAKKSPSKLNDEIVAITQVMLKQEWQRVKTFS
ncbi:hypothetical protein [Vibrio ziniensis]|uniref:Uncharacterized protein n=1 Tax=Vibrio ziniensis TaxID=2711221 RepID=A0A6G7CNL0_9VIBR|nr:hypothetical protein [Vibrio ziniensis]QIH43721.1 hypothetical protein G5S32_17185 [Vibrio ziniensis]